jgi:predicted nucleic-acid-binding protein
MTERRLVDTNLIIRFLVEDHKQFASVAEQLFAASDRGELTLTVLPTVLAECVFVLGSFYKQSRAEIASVLEKIIANPGIELSERAIHLDALARYRNSKAHFVDCLIAATAAHEDIAVATFDRDFRRFSDVRVNVD